MYDVNFFIVGRNRVVLCGLSSKQDVCIIIIIIVAEINDEIKVNEQLIQGNTALLQIKRSQEEFLSLLMNLQPVN